MISAVSALDNTISPLIKDLELWKNSGLSLDEFLVYETKDIGDTNFSQLLPQIFEELKRELPLISEIKQISKTRFNIIYDTFKISCCYHFDVLKYLDCKFIQPINRFTLEVI